MKKNILAAVILFLSFQLNAQYYFPPKTGSTWETIDPSNLGWCQDSINSLYQMLDDGKSKGFMVLKDGKIVLEKYFNGHTKDSIWYWASAAKTMTAFLVGRAQEQGMLNIDSSTSKYLGNGWTSMTTAQEKAVTVKHQLTMTTGMNPLLFDCYTPSCLKYWKDPGTQWYYYNAPYTLLKDVVQNATGKNYNAYFQGEVVFKTGITGLWVQSGFNNLLFSTTRSMAKFGSLILNKGVWDGTKIITDTNYLNDCISPSQNLNKSYGYLWWLNGKESYMLPASLAVNQGSMAPNAPADMYAGIGKNGQYVCVIPSQNMVVVRMGESPDSALVPNEFVNKIFGRLNNMSCGNSTVSLTKPKLSIYPNPSIGGSITIKVDKGNEQELKIWNSSGKLIKKVIANNSPITLDNLPQGIYLLNIGKSTEKIIVN